MADFEALAVTAEVARALEQLGVPYFIGGSLASSFHGIPRASQDADLVADLRAEHVARFVERLSGRFYVDNERVHDAIRRRASFNLIHLASLFKIDVFVLKDEPLAHEELRRRQRIELPGGPLDIASPEDTILQKLLWYRLGSEVSERQWQDVLGVLKVKRGRLDLDYLRQWARRVGIEDLLDAALSAAAPPAGLST